MRNHSNLLLKLNQATIHIDLIKLSEVCLQSEDLLLSHAHASQVRFLESKVLNSLTSAPTAEKILEHWWPDFIFVLSSVVANWWMSVRGSDKAETHMTTHTQVRAVTFHSLPGLGPVPGFILGTPRE